MEKYCGSCKYFRLNPDSKKFGTCISDESKIRNKYLRSIKSKVCNEKELR